MDQPIPRASTIPARLLLVLAVLSCSIGCDRATKAVAEYNLRDLGRISLWHDFLRLEYVRNSGAFLSMGAQLPEPWRSLLFVGGVAVMIVVLVVLALARPRARIQVVAFALIAGGGLGNLWDRVVSGAVTDFMNLGIGSLRTGIFNVADLAIVAGIALLLVRSRPLVQSLPQP
jgi:signal peptidase II